MNARTQYMTAVMLEEFSGMTLHTRGFYATLCDVVASKDLEGVKKISKFTIFAKTDVIAKQMGINEATVYRNLKRLEKHGLVKVKRIFKRASRGTMITIVDVRNRTL